MDTATMERAGDTAILWRLVPAIEMAIIRAHTRLNANNPEGVREVLSDMQRLLERARCRQVP